LIVGRVIAVAVAIAVAVVVAIALIVLLRGRGTVVLLRRASWSRRSRRSGRVLSLRRRALGAGSCV
jgi:UPF0716 family protein affecting phage T7 exclusion